MKYLLVFSIALFGCTFMDNSNVSSKPNPPEEDYDSRPPMTSTEVCMVSHQKGTQCKLAVSSSVERFVSFCKSDPGIVEILRKCNQYRTCEAFQKCSKLRPAEEAKPIPVPPVASEPETKEEPEKPNPKVVLCDVLKDKLTKCFKPEELQKLGTDLDKFLFNCMDEVLPNYNKEKNFTVYLECHMKDQNNDCPVFNKCVRAGAKEREEARLKAEREALETQKTEYKKKPFFAAKKKYCTIAISIIQTCRKYAYQKILLEEKITKEQMIERCIFNKMEDEPEEDKWKNWAFCFDKTGTNCKEFNTCVEQVDN